MSNMTKNELTVNKFTLLGTTSSTSFDFVVSIDSFDASSTTINFTKNTAYIENGCIIDFGTATTTSVSST
jgi:hypothetical protein